MASLNTGLLANYPMDEASGTALVDTTGTNAPGTLVGATRAAGHSVGGLAFGGAGYAALGVVALPAANAPQSLSWWQDAPTSGGIQSVLSLTNDAASSAVEAGFCSGHVGIWPYGGAFLVSATPPSANAWHHYAYTFDGTNHRLYIDGAQVASSQAIPQAAAPTALNLGRWTGGQEYFTGQMDDLRIYGRALAAAEVLALANDQILPNATNTPTNTPTRTATATATVIGTPAAPGQVTMRLRCQQARKVGSWALLVQGRSLAPEPSKPHRWATRKEDRGSHDRSCLTPEDTAPRTRSVPPLPLHQECP